MARSISLTVARRLAVAGALVVAGLATAAPTVAADAGCPPTVAVSDLTAGEDVTGLTVSSGTTPDQFTGTILGVLKDGIAPGLDLIIADLDSPAIETAGGIWAGMSGSPVYDTDGNLIGAVSYGLSAAPSQIAGITPAADMYSVLDEASAAAASPSNIQLSSGLHNAVVSSGAATSTEADSGLHRLPVPLGVSGLSASRLQNPTLMTHFSGQGLIPYAAGSAPAPSSVTASDPGTTIVPGSNFAAGMSYGDVSFIAVGTATAVCGNNVVAFGHPFLFNGRTAESMHGGDTVVVQDDATFGSYKLTNPTAPIGTITEDRLAGIAGPIGATPAVIPVTTSTTSETRHRDGETDVVFPDLLPDMTAFQVLGNVDRIFDQIGPGDATVHTVITGKRSDGTPWTFDRTDRNADPYDAAFGLIFPIYDDVATLQQNSLDKVSIDSVNVTTDIEPGYTNWHVSSVELRSPSGAWVKIGPRHPAKLVAGSRAQMLVHLTGYQGAGTLTVPETFTVPGRTVGQVGDLLVSGGAYGQFRDFGGGSSTSGAATFDDLLNQLQNAPRDDDLLATLQFGNLRTKLPSTGSIYNHQHKTRLDRVITGHHFAPVTIVRPAAPKPGFVSGRTWAVRNSLTSGPPSATFSFGTGTGTPLMGDWDGDGIITPAVYSNGVWMIRPSSLSTDKMTVSFGGPGDQPVVGDWNGDGIDDIGYVGGGQFVMRSDLSPTATTTTVALPAGVSGRAVAGDWNGDGIDTLGFVKSGTWTLLNRNTAGATTRAVSFAGSGVPVVGDWDRDGRSGIGYYHAGTWVLRNSPTSGRPSLAFVFGARGTLPVVAR